MNNEEQIKVYALWGVYWTVEGLCYALGACAFLASMVEEVSHRADNALQSMNDKVAKRIDKEMDCNRPESPIEEVTSKDTRITRDEEK